MLVPVMANIMTTPFGVEISPKFTFGTEIDFANKDLYKDNPEVTLDGKLSEPVAAEYCPPGIVAVCSSPVPIVPDSEQDNGTVTLTSSFTSSA